MGRWDQLKIKLRTLWKTLVAYTVFLVLLELYFVVKILGILRCLHLNPARVIRRIEGLMDKIDGKGSGEVSRIYLIELSLRNLKAKKTRAVITIGGVAVGVGAIVFLVSLGYGLERLVISRVARLEELKMIDVGLGEVAAARMNDGVVEKIAGVEGVKEVILAVSMVAKVKYKNSVVDVMSIGVDERYITAMGVKMASGVSLKGKSEGGDVGWRDEEEGEVAGVSQEIEMVRSGDRVSKRLISFNVELGKFVPIWEECSRESKMLGFIISQEGGYIGEKLWGERYYLEGGEGRVGRSKNGKKEYSVWVRTKAALWKEGEEEGVVPMLGDNSRQQWEIGCLMGLDIREDGDISGYETLDEYLLGGEEKIMDGRILGVTTTSVSAAVVAAASASGSGEPMASSASVVASSSAVIADLFETVVATDSAGVEWIELKKVGEGEKKTKALAFVGEPLGEAFVSLGMLRVFGLSKEKLIGEKFGVSFIVPDGLVPGMSGRLESEEASFKVVGVVEDESSNYFYFHLNDAKRLGVKNYSQLKVVVADQTVVPKVRREIETVGLRTVSTLDTVAEIERLFRTLRMVLGLLGTIALAVAALGMFNTMTVSLLERTREVGVMKAMGMLSDDVRELFLAESMIMGVGGGVLGVVMGVLSGKLLSIALSSVSIFKGQGVIDISFVPVFFIVFIMLISFFVGILTGWYPSRRARSISALNALRYE